MTMLPTTGMKFRKNARIAQKIAKVDAEEPEQHVGTDAVAKLVAALICM